MICEHKRESRSAPASTPLPSLGTCLESSWLWLCAGFPPFAAPVLGVSGLTLGRQSVEPLLTSVECLPPHSFTHDSLQQPLLRLWLSLFPLYLFLPSATARFSIVFAAILLPAAPLTAASPCPSSANHCLILPLSLSGEGSPKGTYEIGKVITLS